MPIPSNSTDSTKRVLLRDRVLAQLREAILDGTLEPGERLYDEALEKWLGVSRTPVREALSELSRSGLVEMSPNRYTRVALPLEEEAVDALQTLGVVLGGVTRLAVPRLTPAARGGIVAQLRKVVEQLRAGDGPRTNMEAILLWRKLSEECGNSLLQDLFDRTADGLAFKLRVATVNKIFDFATIADTFEEFGRCIEEGDAVGAELAVERAHLLPSDPE